MTIIDEWDQHIIANNYGPYTAGPPRLVGHCTDGPWGAIDYNLNASRPHYHTLHVIRPLAQRRTVQTCPLNRSCGGLKKPPAGRITNHRTALQWSIAGPASQMHTLTEEECVWLGTELQPYIRTYPMITMDHKDSVGPGDHVGPIATPSWPGRLSWFEWDHLTGWTQHQRVPENDHYDIYFHEWQFQLIIDIAHLGANMAKIDDMYEPWYQNHIDFESGQPGFVHPRDQDMVARIKEMASRVGSFRNAPDILTPIHKLSTDVDGRTKTILSYVDSLEASMTTVISKLNQILALPPSGGGGLTETQARQIFREELDKTKLSGT